MLNLSHELRASDFQDCGPAYDDEDFGSATPEEKLAGAIDCALDSLTIWIREGMTGEEALKQAALYYGVDPQDLTDRYNNL